MSLARAFTKRNKRSVDQTPQRGNTVRYVPGTINRSLISLPTELISTTNVQALNAPDIRSISGSSAGSISSGHESDFSTIDRSFLMSAGSGNSSGTDTSSIDSSGPATPVTPAADDVKSFFDAKNPVPVPALAFDAPAIPQRAPSHSKKAHVELSRKRSIQRMSPPPTSIAKPSVRTSGEPRGPAIDAHHPFGKELAQVNEMAEEFGATARLLDDEEREILNKGLCKFGVEDYLDEIAGLYGGIFEDRLGPMAKPWI